MDIGEIELRLPTVTDINDQLVEFVKDYVMKKTSNVLVKISQQENLPRDRLMQYVHNIDFEDISTSVNTKRPRKKVDVKDRCLAKTSKGCQCTRKRKNDLYCGSHENSRPYGEVETCIPVDKSKPVIKVRADIETCLP
jgi:hypothetical protein